MNTLRLITRRSTHVLDQRLDCRKGWSTLEHLPVSETSADVLRKCVKGERRRIEKHFGPCEFLDMVSRGR